MDLSGSKKPHIRWRPKSPTGEGQFWEHLPAHCEVQGISGVSQSYFCRWYTSLFKISSLPCQQSCIYTESRNKDEHRLPETNQINSNCKLSYLRTNLHQQNYLSAIIIVKKQQKHTILSRESTLSLNSGWRCQALRVSWLHRDFIFLEQLLITNDKLALLPVAYVDFLLTTSVFSFVADNVVETIAVLMWPRYRLKYTANPASVSQFAAVA